LTHTPPTDPEDALEISTAIKERLGLDRERSCVILSNANASTSSLCLRWPLHRPTRQLRLFWRVGPDVVTMLLPCVGRPALTAA
jgi:hypothetical protein